ncbi:aminotransferase class V-fold PLP-dependent enzyme [Acidobacteriota bacterium]
MIKTGWDLKKDLEDVRNEFPILDKCVYLISNSLGAVPKKTEKNLQQFYLHWAKLGASAWEKRWWDLSSEVSNKIALLIGAKKNEVTMMPNATIAHWVVLSTRFHDKIKKKNKIVMTDHDFPSSLYAAFKISEFSGWDIDIVKSNGNPAISVKQILDHIDEKTLFVVTSHVYFKSAYIQDIRRIAKHAHQVGALTLIDGYHAPGSIPVNVKKLDVDFYVGGCLKWLCGGPGNAFIYIKQELKKLLQPQLTGWFAHKSPFAFSMEMEYAEDSYKFMSGTPPIPCLYAALEGLRIIQKIGLPQIRKKSLYQTQMIFEKAQERGFQLYSVKEQNYRGGAVSINLPHAFQVKQAVEDRKIKVDFRKGKDSEPDVIRVGPHFYTQNEEIDIFFKEIDEIYRSKTFKKYPDKSKRVT